MKSFRVFWYSTKSISWLFIARWTLCKPIRTSTKSSNKSTLYWVLSYRRNSFPKKETTKMRKYKTPKSLSNFKTSFSSPLRKETSYFVRPLTTGDSLLTALRLWSRKSSIKNPKISLSFYGVITTSTPKPNSFHKNPETKMTDLYALIWYSSPYGTFLKIFNQKTRRRYKKSSQPLA